MDQILALSIEPLPLVFAAICALALMPVVIYARALGHHQLASPQHVHSEPTSRLGGGIVFVAFAAGAMLAVVLRQVPYQPVLALLACTLPVLLAGLWEDVTGHLSPRQRLVAAAISALLASVFAGGVIARLDFPYVDDWLDFRVLAVLLTCFMVMGACNALNLIDGAHGLLGGTALLMFAGLAGAAAHVGDRLVFAQAAAMIGALAGFLCWNYPRGRVFMGDGGAYFIGFIYAELSIQIVVRNEHLSAWFVIMLAAYPIVETLYSIYRRKILLRTPSTEPDALHLHSLVYHQLELPAEQFLPETNPDRANARVAPRLWLHSVLCGALALSFHDNTGALIASLASYAVLYHWQYRSLMAQRGPHPVRTFSELKEQRGANGD